MDLLPDVLVGADITLGTLGPCHAALIHRRHVGHAQSLLDGRAASQEGVGERVAAFQEFSARTMPRLPGSSLAKGPRASESWS